jgi:short subunit dehydrogenase-like uncharacterized protein
MQTREFDIALLGATGFTGRLIAAYLVRHAHTHGYRVALAGRNEARGQALIADLQRSGRPSSGLGWITADIEDEASLARLASKTHLVMNAAGPFALHGPPVVRACVAHGTHHIDLTGEPDFVALVEREFSGPALESGSTVVCACGFDSLPADLGTLMIAAAMPEKSRLTVRSFFRTNARFSAGTWRTAILALGRRFSREKRPARRVPRPANRRKIPLRIHRHKPTGRWAIPMPVVDPHIVVRSAGAMPETYGPSFAYGQFFTAGSFWKMLRLVVPIAALLVLARFAIFRRWLLSRIQPGTGPDAATRQRSRFEVRLFAECEETGERAEAVVSGGDPGYNETAKMFSETGFCLLEKARNGSLRPGVQTPAVAFGHELIDRLRAAGIVFELR